MNKTTEKKKATSTKKPGIKSKTYPTNYSIKFHYRCWVELKENFDKFISVGLFRKRPSINEVTAYVQEMSKASANMWQEIYNLYPELQEEAMNGAIITVSTQPCLEITYPNKK